MRYTKTLTTAVAVALIVGVGSTADADPVDLSASADVLAGTYTFAFGEDDLDCDTIGAFALSDGSSDSSGDAVDGAGVVSVAGTLVNDADGIVDSTVDGDGTTLAMATQTIASLNVDLSFRSIGTDGVLRELLTLFNPTAAPITVTVDMESNWGADEATVIAGTSSGDGTLTSADRWIVAADTAEEPNDDTIPGVVFFGPGSPAVPPSSLADQGLGGFNCSGAEGATASYSVTVPVGQARQLMWFFRLTDPDSSPVQLESASTEGDVVAQSAGAPVIFGATIPEAVGRMAIFDTNPAAGSALVAGIDAAQLPNIVNWDYPAAQPTTTTTAPPTTTTTTTTTPAPAQAAAAGAVRAQPSFTG